MDRLRDPFSGEVSSSLVGVISVAVVGMVLGKLFRYLINFVVATGLNAKSLGFFTFGLVLVRACSVVGSLGLRTASQRFISVANQEGDPSALFGATVISLATPLIFGSVLAAGLYFAWPSVTAELNLGVNEDVRVFFLAVPLYAVMMVGATATRGFKQTKYYVYIREFGQSGLAILLIAMAAYWFASTTAVIYAYFASLVFGSVLTVWFLYALGALRSDVVPEFDLTGTFSVSLPLLIVAASQYLISWTDILMLGGLTSSTDVGHYQVAFLYAALLYIAFQAINAVFPSMAAEMYTGGDLDELQNTYSLVTKWGIYVTAVGMVLVIAYADVLLRLFGTGYTVATTTLIVLAIGRTIASIPGPASFILSMSDYEQIESMNTAIFAGLNVLLNFLLIPSYGILGAGIATSTSLVSMNFVRLTEVWWYFDVHPFHQGYIKGVLAFLATSGFVFFLQPYSQGLLGAVTMGIFALAIFGIGLLILGLDDQDQRLLKQA